MTEEEITTILGATAGDYSGFARPKTVLGMTFDQLLPGETYSAWVSEEFVVFVAFDESRRAIDVQALQLDEILLVGQAAVCVRSQ